MTELTNKSMKDDFLENVRLKWSAWYRHDALSRLIKEIGVKYNHLVIIDIEKPIIYSEGKKPIVVCVCDCGKTGTYRYGNIKNGHTTSCGCFGRERTIKSVTIHGMSGTPLNVVYNGMIRRCTDKKFKGYHRYGGRGISVCDEWLHDFQSFYE